MSAVARLLHCDFLRLNVERRIGAGDRLTGRSVLRSLAYPNRFPLLAQS